MIVNGPESLVIDYLDWADKGSLWVCHPDSLRIEAIKVQDTRGMSLHSGKEGFFAVDRRISSNESEISVRSMLNPGEPLAKVSISDDKSMFQGDDALWSNVPTMYARYIRKGTSGYYALLRLAPDNDSVEIQPMSWFENGPYDFDRQAPGMISEVPGTKFVLICVARDSFPVLYDPLEQRVIRKISLAGERGFVLGGNTHFYFRRTKSELWTDDNSVMLGLNPRDWTVFDLLDVEHPGSFIGQFEFNHDESLCAVPRPFRGDVIAIDTDTFQITHRAVLGRQPLRVALLSDGRVMARDWKTGDLLYGQLERLPEGPPLSYLIATTEDLYEQVRLLINDLRYAGEANVSERLTILIHEEPNFRVFGDLFSALGSLRGKEVTQQIGWVDRVEVMIAFATSNMKIEIVTPKR